MKTATTLILLAGLLAGAGLVAAAEPPPHPGEPAAHRELAAGAEGTPARLYAREHPEGPPRVEPLYASIGRVDHWELVLPKLHPSGKDAVLTVAARDGKVVNGYTLAPGADNLFHYTSTYRLDLVDGKLTGSVRIRFLPTNRLNAAEYLPDGQERVVIFEASNAAGKVSGKGEAGGWERHNVEDHDNEIVEGHLPLGQRPE